MSLCLIYLDQPAQVWFEQGLWQRVVWLSLMVGAGATAYFATLLILGVRPQQLLLKPTITSAKE